MNKKHEILKIIYESENYISGKEISERLKISRQAINIHVKNLIEEGFSIEATKNKGYNLNLVNKVVPELIDEFKVISLDSVDSTNNYALHYLKNHEVDQLLVVAREQTNGRGRKARKFISQKDKGIYMSYVKKVFLNIENSQLITICVANALHKTLTQYYGEQFAIKWINDIYIGENKLAGILVEVDYNIETKKIGHLIIGIGINIEKQEDYAYLQMLDKKVDTNEVVKKLIYNIDQEIKMENEIVIEYYKKNCFILNRDVLVNEEVVHVIDITENGNLKVINSKNEEQILSSEDISLSQFNKS